MEAESFVEVDLQGKYVTPGLVDMHSHHLAGTWPGFPDVDDFNEMHPDTGPLTPFVRVLDALKAYDFQAITKQQSRIISICPKTLLCRPSLVFPRNPLSRIIELGM